LRLAVGLVLLVLGFAGLFLPVLQGMLLIALGTALLSVDVRALARWRCAAVAWWCRQRRRLKRQSP